MTRARNDTAEPVETGPPGATDPAGGSTSRRSARTASSPVQQPRLGPVGTLRWAWRQLTSMRTALLLLLLVAVGAIPGSIWPQRQVDSARVAEYLQDHPSLGPWLDRLGLFDVYTSPWFSAIYLLLLLSLIGCIVPRTALHWRALRTPPPRAPQRPERLPVSATVTVPGAPEDVEARLRKALRTRRYRVRPDGEPGAVAAESGYLRETGNLLFHLAILVVIVALAWGHLVGWRADRIVVVGQSFANTVRDYDTFAPGPWVNTGALQPFTIRVDDLDVRFEEQAGGAQFGAARDFRATTTVRRGPDSPPEQRSLSVNGPLDFGGASVYLLGNGYAPVITVRDARGQVLYSQATPFLPQDNFYRSTGAVKVTGASPQQLGFSGLFLPTGYLAPEGPASAFPGLRRPVLVLTGFRGELFPGGRGQSVYNLDVSGMTQLTDSGGRPLRIWLEPGRTVTLPDDLGSITMEEVPRWAGLSTRYDPAKPLALASSLLALAGLVASLLIRRRRVFARLEQSSPPSDAATDQAGPWTTVRVGALGKGEDPMLDEALRRLVEQLGGRQAPMKR